MLFLASATRCVRFDFAKEGAEEKKSAIPRLPRAVEGEEAATEAEEGGADKEEEEAKDDDDKSKELVSAATGSENLASTCWGTKNRASPP